MRLPKRRGFKNKRKSPKSITINLKDLNALSGTVDRKALIAARLLSPRATEPVKILGNGEIKKPIILKGILVSKGVKIKIEKAGGEIRA